MLDKGVMPLITENPYYRHFIGEGFAGGVMVATDTGLIINDEELKLLRSAFEGGKKTQLDADQLWHEAKERERKEKRLEYEKDFTSQIVTHTRRELKLEFAEWLKEFRDKNNPNMDTVAWNAICLQTEKLRKEAGE